MYKKVNVIVFMVILLLFIIPISIFAFNRNNKVQLIEKISYDELEDNIGNKQRELDYSRMINEEVINIEDIVTDEIDDEINEMIAKAKKQEEQITNIMNRFYPDKFNKIVNEISENPTGQFDGRFDENGGEIKLFTLILDVIENENLTEEEVKILKDFMIENLSNLKWFPEIQERVNKCCL